MSSSGSSPPLSVESLNVNVHVNSSMQCFSTCRPESSAAADELMGDKKLILLTQTDHLRELHTILRDKHTPSSDFVFGADRLIRLVIEEALNQLPYHKHTVVTPTGHYYRGIKFTKGNCGVAICRSGEAMESALRQCCRSIRIGKILISEDQRMLYARLTADIAKRRVLLLYPLVSTGATVSKAIEILIENGVEENRIVLISIFSTPLSIRHIRARFKSVILITSEICTDVPAFFSTRYFGTD